MNNAIIAFATKLNTIRSEKASLEAAKEKMQKELHDLWDQEQWLKDAILDTDIDLDTVERKLGFLRLELNTQLPYSDLKNLYEITDGPLF